MALPPFAAGIEIVSKNNITRPPNVKTTDQAPSATELDAIELPNYGLIGKDVPESVARPEDSYSHKQSKASSFDEVTASKTPGELEQSQPATPQSHDGADIVPTLWYPKMNPWRVLAACLEYFGNGLNDSAPGALIPYIEAWYGIGYAVVSTIWISNAAGFIVAAFVSDFICAKLGRAKSLMLAELSIMAAYTVIACPVPFPVVVVAYAFVGFGEALQIAYNNVFIANLANSTVILGWGHGSYGIGGVIGPIMATTLVTAGFHWSRFYAITLGVRVLSMILIGWSFWSYEKEEISQFSNSLQQMASRQSAAELGTSSKFKLIGRALKLRVTLIGALFVFAYQGAEVSESGWVITYLIEYRNADPAHVGYVTSGFWGGITIGRFVLTHLARRFGEKRLVFAMCLGTIVFQLLVWFVPNVVGESVAVAIVGLLLGPIYPCAQTVFTRLLPGNLQVFAIAFISSMGSSGGAVVPFLTGLIAQAAGTFVLHPIVIAFVGVMILGWAVLPRVSKRKE